MSTSSVPRYFEKYNPSTGERLKQYTATAEEALPAIVSSAKAAQTALGKARLSTRAQVLKTVARLLYEQADAVAALISQEIGKPLADALEADIGPALSALTYYAQHGPKRLRPKPIAPDPISLITARTHQEHYHPRGVIAIISPWNYPIAIATGGIAAAVMAGNAVILKPSEHAPACGLKLVALFQQALQHHHLPAECVQVALGDGQTGAALLEQRIDGVIFTGSEAVGQRIQRIAGERNLWSSLELGGSDAMIVLPNCDLELAASYALWGRFANAGQACAATKRLLVHAQDEERLLQHLRQKIAQLRVGPPQAGDSHLGPLISQTQRETVDTQVQDAIAQGATVLAGGRRIDRPGWFYEPTLLCKIPATAQILNEEVFGPVLPVITYQTLEEAVASVNASPFGLTTSMMGDVRLAQELAPQLQCGTVVINDAGTSNFAMLCAPWGGWKKSGSGSSHGQQALIDLSQKQIVSVNQSRSIPGLSKPLWQFAKNPANWRSRTKAVLAFCARNPLAIANPRTWLAFWEHRASTKL